MPCFFVLSKYKLFHNEKISSIPIPYSCRLSFASTTGKHRSLLLVERHAGE